MDSEYIYTCLNLVDGETEMKNFVIHSVRIFRGTIWPDEAAAQKQEVPLDERCDLVSGAIQVAEIRDVPVAGGADTSLHLAHVSASVSRVDYSSECDG